MPIQINPYPNWDYNETMKRIKAIETPQIKAFAKIGYLLGGRLSELLELKPDKITIEDGFVTTILRTRKVRKTSYREIVNVVADEWFYVSQLINFKKYNRPLNEYIRYGYKSIERKLTKELGTIPHGLRHLRATHLGKQLIPSKIHQPTAPYLKHYFGWTKLETASYYIDSLTVNDIKQHYLKSLSTNGLNASTQQLPNQRLN